MQGHHEVKVFRLNGGDESVVLPSGWKPFAVYGSGYPLFIVARKWIRDEKEA